MKEIIKINKKGLLDTYFSEIMVLPNIAKIDWHKYKFKILLGGKGRGKSYLAFEELKKYIQLGEPVIYMRNSLDEIKNMKPALLEMVKQYYPEQKIKCSDEGISLLEDGKVLITFVSTKNYNKISGNLKPYSMVFYDEFNQIMKTDTAKMVDDFFNICQTVFRHNEWNIWACGNTKTANNILYNLLKHHVSRQINTQENLTCPPKWLCRISPMRWGFPETLSPKLSTIPVWFHLQPRNWYWKKRLRWAIVTYPLRALFPFLLKSAKLQNQIPAKKK